LYKAAFNEAIIFWVLFISFYQADAPSRKQQIHGA